MSDSIGKIFIYDSSGFDQELSDIVGVADEAWLNILRLYSKKSNNNNNNNVYFPQTDTRPIIKRLCIHIPKLKEQHKHYNK